MIDCNCSSLMGTAATGVATTITITRIEQAIREILQPIEDEWATVAAGMQRKGFDVDRGARLVLPERFRYMVQHPTPPWVLFSNLLPQPAMIRGTDFKHPESGWMYPSLRVFPITVISA